MSEAAATTTTTTDDYVKHSKRKTRSQSPAYDTSVNSKIDDNQSASKRVSLLSAVQRTNSLLSQAFTQSQLDKSIILMSSYALLSLLFGGFQIALLIINFQSQQYIEDHIFLPFHLGEFWAIFLFTLLEAFILTTAGVIDASHVPTPHGRFVYLYLATLALNILLTFVGAVLFTMDPERFERPAHLIEYIAQIPIAFIDIVFVIQRGLVDEAGRAVALSWASFRAAIGGLAGVVAVLIFILSIIQLFAYDSIIVVNMPGEQVAHFFEFPIELVNAAFALWFALRSRQILHRKCHVHEHF
jgi:hypothetical protein